MMTPSEFKLNEIVKQRSTCTNSIRSWIQTLLLIAFAYPRKGLISMFGRYKGRTSSLWASLPRVIYWLKLRALQKRVQDNLDLHTQNTTIPPPALNQEVIISRLHIYERNCESRSSGRLSQAGRREKYSKKLNYNLTFDTASDTTEKKKQ